MSLTLCLQEGGQPCERRFFGQSPGALPRFSLREQVWHLTCRRGFLRSPGIRERHSVPRRKIHLDTGQPDLHPGEFAPLKDESQRVSRWQSPYSHKATTIRSASRCASWGRTFRNTLDRARSGKTHKTPTTMHRENRNKNLPRLRPRLSP